MQIYFSNKSSKEALEEVFVTDLEVDFPDFKMAQVAQKGVWETCVFNFLTIFSNKSQDKYSHWHTQKSQWFIRPIFRAHILPSDTAKQKKMPAELCGALISFSYLKVSVAYAVYAYVIIKVFKQYFHVVTHIVTVLNCRFSSESHFYSCKEAC